jgi:hypothetical protein
MKANQQLLSLLEMCIIQRVSELKMIIKASIDFFVLQASTILNWKISSQKSTYGIKAWIDLW